MKRFHFWLTMIVLSASLAAAQGESNAKDKASSDQRVKKLLDLCQLSYEVDRDGDFRVINQLETNRSQVIFINSRTNRFYDLEVREIWSVVSALEKPLDAESAGKLLLENGHMKVGAWGVQQVGGKFMVVFSAQIPANADTKTLLATLEAVGLTADLKEREFSGKDFF